MSALFGLNDLYRGEENHRKVIKWVKGLPFVRLPTVFPKPLPISGKFYHHSSSSIKDIGFVLIFITFTPK